MTKQTLDDWFSHIKQLHHQRIELGLDRVGCVADRLQLKNFSSPVITVGGTNGKGSCTKTLESIYQAAGYRTALYTSPHLMHFNERIRFNNSEITDAELIHVFEIIEKARENVILSFFEFTTLAGLYFFKQKNPDVIILEIGLGGRLDAVNIVESDIAIVTSIALDHMDFLGDNRESIAYEKASIARENKPFICGEEDPPDNIEKTAFAKKAILYQIKKAFDYEERENQLHYFLFRASEAHGVSLSEEKTHTFPKPHLKSQNIATAITAIELLQSRLPVSYNAIEKGLLQINLPGRFEITASPFPCILDVAHNPHAALWLAEQYAQLSPVKNTVAIIGMLKDKAMCETILPLIPFIQTWCVCSLKDEQVERGSDGKEMVDFLKQQGVKNHCLFSTVFDAMQFISKLHCQQECDRGLIFGSFHTVALAKQWIEKNNQQGVDAWKKEPKNV